MILRFHKMDLRIMPEPPRKFKYEEEGPGSLFVVGDQLLAVRGRVKLDFMHGTYS